MEQPSVFSEQKVEHHAKKQSVEDEAYNQLSKNVTEVGSRLRILEEQYSNLRNRAQLTDHNLLEFEKDINKEVKALDEDVLDLKKMMQDILEKLSIVSSELANSVKEYDFRVIDKYVDLWNPGQFVTKDKLRQEIEDVLREE